MATAIILRPTPSPSWIQTTAFAALTLPLAVLLQFGLLPALGLSAIGPDIFVVWLFFVRLKLDATNALIAGALCGLSVDMILSPKPGWMMIGCLLAMRLLSGSRRITLCWKQWYSLLIGLSSLSIGWQCWRALGDWLYGTAVVRPSMTVVLLTVLVALPVIVWLTRPARWCGLLSPVTEREPKSGAASVDRSSFFKAA
ncbi:MAG: hypothetical protein ABIH86_02925 [Planctomycetota bacterium]